MILKLLQKKTFLLLTIIMLGFFLRSPIASAFTCHAVLAGGNWGDTSTWENCNSTVPQTGDDVVLDATSGSVAVNTASNSLNSLDMTGYTGTLSGSSNITAAPSTGSTYVKLGGTITWTGTLNLGPTNTATTTLLSSGVSLPGNISVPTTAGAGAHVVFEDGVTMTGSGKTLTLRSGYLHFDGASDNSGLSHRVSALDLADGTARRLYLGTSSTTLYSTISSTFHISCNGSSSLTVPTNTATITVTTSSSYTCSTSAASVNWNGASFIYSGVSPTFQTINATFGNLTIAGPASKTGSITLNTSGSSITVTGTLTLAGNSSTNRILVTSNTIGTARTLTVNGSVSASNVDFRDITGAGSASWDLSAATGGSGDAGGNTNITFTTGSTQTWQGSSGGSWSDSTKWSSRVPLPQDDVSFAGVDFSSGQTVTMDMPRAGRSLDLSGYTFSGTKPIFTFNALGSLNIFGSLTLQSTSNMTWTIGASLLFNGRSPDMPVGGWTLTSAGQTMVYNVTFQHPTGTYKLMDAFIARSDGGAINHTIGTINTNGFSVTGVSWSGNNSNTKVTTIDNSTITLSGTSFAWLPTNSGCTGLTFSGAGSTVVLSNTTSTSKTFYGCSLTYNNVSFTGGGSGAVIVAGSNFFNKLTVNAPKTVTFTSGTTQRVNRFVALGTASNPITLNASTGGSVATLSMPGGNTFVGDYLTITDLTATGGAKWYAGANSSLSNSTGWLLQAGPQRRGSFIQDSKVRLEKGKMIIRAR